MEAIGLADAYGVADGFPLDESQQFTLRAALGERSDHSWAASTVGDFEPRQNGKNDTVAARELAGLVLFGERLIIHTAHEYPTANEAFLRLVAVFENWDELRRKVARVRYGHGEQAIEMRSGQRLMYRARTGKSGRGFAMADLLVYDEAQHLQAEHLAASGPTKLANPNAQSWYVGSGGLATSANAWRMRRRALVGNGGRFAYVEHTAETIGFDSFGQLVSERPDVADRDAWARANAAFGRRITEESMQAVLEELGPELFARECLCLWDAELGADDRIISADQWDAVNSRSVAAEAGIVIAVDVNPERTQAAIAASDNAGTVELLEHRPGTGWLVARAVAIAKKAGAKVAVNLSGPAGSYSADIAKDATVVDVSGTELVQACGAFYDAVVDGRLAVRRDAALDAAIAGARRRFVGEAWAWTRKGEVDISPLMAASLARWVATHTTPMPAPATGSAETIAQAHNVFRPEGRLDI